MLLFFFVFLFDCHPYRMLFFLFFRFFLVTGTRTDCCFFLFLDWKKHWLPFFCLLGRRTECFFLPYRKTKFFFSGTRTETLFFPLDWHKDFVLFFE